MQECCIGVRICIIITDNSFEDFLAWLRAKSLFSLELLLCVVICVVAPSSVSKVTAVIAAHRGYMKELVVLEPVGFTWREFLILISVQILGL